MKGILWLASYPKSGNTWFRAFLTNLRSEDPDPVDIDEIGGGGIASARGLFDDAAGVEASDLTYDEVDRLRPYADEVAAEECEEPIFRKIHDAYTDTPEGRPLVSSAATIGAIYFIRNPLDVAVSYAHHNATDVDSAVAMMADPDHALCSRPGRLHNQLRQRMLSWSGHVLSWIDSPLPVHVLRYEDMHAHALDTFSGAVRFAELDYDTDAIQAAIEASSFDRLKSQEHEHGFREKNPRSESFFRKGVAGSWRESLSHAQRDRVIGDHESVMRRFGYLTDDREPVY